MEEDKLIENNQNIFEVKRKDDLQKLYVERLERFFVLVEKSNEWKKNYEYYQQSKNINENSIIVSET